MPINVIYAYPVYLGGYDIAAMLSAHFAQQIVLCNDLAHSTAYLVTGSNLDRDVAEMFLERRAAEYSDRPVVWVVNAALMLFYRTIADFKAGNDVPRSTAFPVTGLRLFEATVLTVHGTDVSSTPLYLAAVTQAEAEAAAQAMMPHFYPGGDPAVHDDEWDDWRKPGDESRTWCVERVEAVMAIESTGPDGRIVRFPIGQAEEVTHATTA